MSLWRDPRIRTENRRNFVHYFNGKNNVKAVDEHGYKEIIRRVSDTLNGGNERVQNNFTIENRRNGNGQIVVRVVEKKSELELVPLEEVFETLEREHLASSHANRKILYESLRVKHPEGNITFEMVRWFVDQCPQCAGGVPAGGAVGKRKQQPAAAAANGSGGSASTSTGRATTLPKNGANNNNGGGGSANNQQNEDDEFLALTRTRAGLGGGSGGLPPPSNSESAPAATLSNEQLFRDAFKSCNTYRLAGSGGLNLNKVAERAVRQMTSGIAPTPIGSSISTALSGDNNSANANNAINMNRSPPPPATSSKQICSNTKKPTAGTLFVPVNFVTAGAAAPSPILAPSSSSTSSSTAISKKHAAQQPPFDKSNNTLVTSTPIVPQKNNKKNDGVHSIPGRQNEIFFSLEDPANISLNPCHSQPPPNNNSVPPAAFVGGGGDGINSLLLLNAADHVADNPTLDSTFLRFMNDSNLSVDKYSALNDESAAGQPLTQQKRPPAEAEAQQPQGQEEICAAGVNNNSSSNDKTETAQAGEQETKDDLGGSASKTIISTSSTTLVDNSTIIFDASSTANANNAGHRRVSTDKLSGQIKQEPMDPEEQQDNPVNKITLPMDVDDALGKSILSKMLKERFGNWRLIKAKSDAGYYFFKKKPQQSTWDIPDVLLGELRRQYQLSNPKVKQPIPTDNEDEGNMDMEEGEIIDTDDIQQQQHQRAPELWTARKEVEKQEGQNDNPPVAQKIMGTNDDGNGNVAQPAPIANGNENAAASVLVVSPPCLSPTETNESTADEQQQQQQRNNSTNQQQREVQTYEDMIIINTRDSRANDVATKVTNADDNLQMLAEKAAESSEAIELAGDSGGVDDYMDIAGFIEQFDEDLATAVPLDDNQSLSGEQQEQIDEAIEDQANKNKRSKKQQKQMAEKEQTNSFSMNLDNIPVDDEMAQQRQHEDKERSGQGHREREPSDEPETERVQPTDRQKSPLITLQQRNTARKRTCGTWKGEEPIRQQEMELDMTESEEEDGEGEEEESEEEQDNLGFTIPALPIIRIELAMISKKLRNCGNSYAKTMDILEREEREPKKRASDRARAVSLSSTNTSSITPSASDDENSSAEKPGTSKRMLAKDRKTRKRIKKEFPANYIDFNGKSSGPEMPQAPKNRRTFSPPPNISRDQFFFCRHCTSSASNRMLTFDNQEEYILHVTSRHKIIFIDVEEVRAYLKRLSMLSIRLLTFLCDECDNDFEDVYVWQLHRWEKHGDEPDPEENVATIINNIQQFGNEAYPRGLKKEEPFDEEELKSMKKRRRYGSAHEEVDDEDDEDIEWLSPRNDSAWQSGTGAKRRRRRISSGGCRGGGGEEGHNSARIHVKKEVLERSDSGLPPPKASSSTVVYEMPNLWPSASTAAADNEDNDDGGEDENGTAENAAELNVTD